MNLTIQPVFQFQTGSIRRCRHTSFSTPCHPGFNSKLVRLEANEIVLVRGVNVCFNSKLVRLEVNAEDTDKILLTSFNSKLVRLEDRGFNWRHGAAHGRFNSKLVRLEDSVDVFVRPRIKCFNSKLVRLEGYTVRLHQRGRVCFNSKLVRLEGFPKPVKLFY